MYISSLVVDNQIHIAQWLKILLDVSWIPMQFTQIQNFQE
jgi:hypothetical protein